MKLADANAVVQDPQFWELGKQVLKLLAPIVKKTDGCSIGMVYATFVHLLKYLRYCRPTFLADTADAILDLIQSRWNFLHTDTMGVGFLLDPTKNPDDFVGNDCNDALEHVRIVAARIGVDGVTQKKAFREANAFVNTKRDWTADERAKQGEVPRERLTQGVFDVGSVGEVAARIFLLLAIHAARKRRRNLPEGYSRRTGQDSDKQGPLALRRPGVSELSK